MNRREFSSSLLAGVAGMALFPSALRAASPPTTLAAVRRVIEVNGKPADVFGLLQPDGTHGLRIAPGADFDIELDNRLDAETLIHWHGLTPPWDLDGVPNMPALLMGPGERRGYRFAAGAPGTHWMHAHTLQEQALLAAPLIVHGKDDLARDEQEAVVLLHDFSFTPAAELLARLQSAGGMGGEQMDGMHMDGMNMSSSDMNMDGATMEAGGHDMMGMDVNDIDYDAYLANDRTLDDPEIVKVEKGGRLRLRLINGATATGFTIDVGALAATVIAVDGQDVVPLKVTQFPLTMGQRVDLRLEIPKEGGAFPILALRERGPERTGVILATPGAAIVSVPTSGHAAGPLLDLASEALLTAARPLAARAPDRTFSVMLTGDMNGYRWGMQTSPDPVVAEGQRIGIEMMNHSMMAHPMHLHGHHFQITAINGTPIQGALRDTVLVPPMSSVSFAFDAINPGGGWAFHCHNLYHMASGMMSTISYQGA